MEVRIKLNHPDAVIPSYSKKGDAGMDLTAINRVYVKKDGHNGFVEYDTGLSLEIPEGYVGFVFPRSSLSKYDLILANHVGVIDSGYRGTIKLRFKLDRDYDHFLNFDGNLASVSQYNGEKHDLRVYQVGDRIGQLLILPYPMITFEQVMGLSDTERGEGGFGHTDN